MNKTRLNLNIFAILASVFVAGLIILISGIVTFTGFSNPTDIYNTSYKEYLMENKAVEGSVWCVESCFAETENFAYALIPAVDKSTFIDQQVLKFVVICYDKSKDPQYNAMADYWNGKSDVAPDDIKFSGVISRAEDTAVSDTVYEYFELEYGFDKQETDKYFLPYVITEVENFSIAYLPKIIVGLVFMVIAIALYFIVSIRSNNKLKSFSESDVPQ